MRELVENIRKSLEPFDYVVQRNWEELPDLDPDHPDLDLFVSNEDYEEVLLLTKEFPWIDLRHPGDGYYPEDIEDMLLLSTEVYNGWKIPEPFIHFISLYYHNAVHKKDNPYEDKLRQLFLEVYPPTEPDDKGVGYYVNT